MDNEKEKKQSEKPKKKVSNIMLVLICVMITLYAAANFILQYFSGVEVSPTLTGAWFTFWTVEIVALAAIKTTKVKNEKSNNTTSENEAVCDNEFDSVTEFDCVTEYNCEETIEKH